MLVPLQFQAIAGLWVDAPLFLFEPIPPCSYVEGQLVQVYSVTPALSHFILMTAPGGQSLIPIFSGPEAETKRGCVLSRRLTASKWQQDPDPGFPGSKTRDLSVSWLGVRFLSQPVLVGTQGLNFLTVCLMSSIPRCIFLHSVTS